MFIESAMHMQDQAYMCMQKAMCACQFLRAHSKGFFGFTFPKIDLFAH